MDEFNRLYPNASVGENIKRIRKARNMTQKELGEKLGGISQQQIGQWENGIKNPKIETIEKIATVLDVNIFILKPKITTDEWHTTETYKKVREKYNIVMDFMKILTYFYGEYEEILDSDGDIDYYKLNINDKQYYITYEDVELLMSYLKKNIPSLIELLSKDYDKIEDYKVKIEELEREIRASTQNEFYE